MKFLFKLFVFSTIVISSTVNAADLKIGYVEVQKLLLEAPQVEVINVKMLDRFGGKKSELEKLEKEIKESQGKYKRNELIMTNDQLEELKKGIIGKVQIYKQKEAALQQEVATMRSQEVAVLQQAIRGIIAELAKNGKYDLILSDGVLHANKSYNITEKVLDEMRLLIKK